MKSPAYALTVLVSAICLQACGRREPAAGAVPPAPAADAGGPEGDAATGPEPEARAPGASGSGQLAAPAASGPGASEAPSGKARKPEEPKEPKEPKEPEEPAKNEAEAGPARSGEAEKTVSEDLDRKACYAVGLKIASTLKQQEVEPDIEALSRGIADCVAGRPKIDQAQLRATLRAHQQRRREGKTGPAGEDASYALGLDVATNLARQGLGVVPKELARGISDGLAGTPGMDEAEVTATMMAYEGRVREKARLAAADNLKKGRAWLAENAKRPGVETRPSGLQYEVLKAGEGASPEPTDRVTVHYRGTLTDGTAFDSSYDRGKPATFALNRVVKGWTEGLGLMKTGAKWKLYIPPDLGYGERPPRTSPIGPNDVLVFEVELLEIK